VTRPFELVLFANDADLATRAVAAGVETLIVDWEWEGKAARQAGADTEVNRQTEDDLRRMRGVEGARVLCRVNATSARTADELDLAVAAGADEVLLPMVRAPGEVEAALDALAGRAGLGILVETEDAIAAAPELARLPLSRVYVGLNDLAIERGARGIFGPLVDGTVERLRTVFAETRFGVGGLTVPTRGAPLPCRLLIGELARAGCDYAFLRRSFLRDTAGSDVGAAVRELREALAAARRRDDGAVAADRRALVDAVAALEESARPEPRVAVA
jgi:hypothetical protein